MRKNKSVRKNKILGKKLHKKQFIIKRKQRKGKNGDKEEDEEEYCDVNDS